ncbi:MAG: hypothetical protein ACO3JL_17645, partial [Myxococcota bacterium]
MNRHSTSLVALMTFALWTGIALDARAQSMCTSASQQNCYRFLCNGMDANGNIENVCSNGCTAQNAPRWASPTIPVRVDRTIVPSSLGTAAWNNVVDGTLDAWEAVSSSNMVLQDIGNADYRRTNDPQSEIFWITSTSEWQQKIGSGVYGALGVTIPLYYCGNPGEITTADLIMNGAGFTNWKATQSQCTGSGCTSARATLLHELGHWVGLDHPCQACAWSAMSASAYTEPDYPLAVDAAAVSALYPGSPGGIGYGCSTNAQCNSPYSCTLVDEVRYCTQTCNGTCPEGFICDDVGGTDYCIYDAGPLARP